MYFMNIWWMVGFFFCSLFLIGACRRYALRVHMLDIPNARSSHITPTPRGGGIGMVLTFLAGSILTASSSALPPGVMANALLACSLVAIIGFIDDHYPLSTLLRLSVHALSSVILLSTIEVPNLLPWTASGTHIYGLDYLILGIALVWLLNLYNFMDGIDGIAAIEGLSVICGALFILWINGSLEVYGSWIGILGMSVAGFLIWNWPPAKIFMGDVGSGFLGFTLGCFAILTSVNQGINIWSWFILLAVFIVDATVTLLRRLCRGDRFWMAHRSHAYQILSRRYKSHGKVTLGVLLINTIWLLPWAYLSTVDSFYPLFCVPAATLPLIILVFRIGAGTTNN